MFPKRNGPQAPRQPGDGPRGEGDLMSIHRIDDDYLEVSCMTHGKRVSIVLSNFNASRVLGSLSVWLNYTLTKAAGKRIKF